MHEVHFDEDLRGEFQGETKAFGRSCDFLASILPCPNGTIQCGAGRPVARAINRPRGVVQRGQALLWQVEVPWGRMLGLPRQFDRAGTLRLARLVDGLTAMT